jgi:hypothetical protein
MIFTWGNNHISRKRRGEEEVKGRRGGRKEREKGAEREGLEERGRGWVR